MSVAFPSRSRKKWLLATSIAAVATVLAGCSASPSSGGSTSGPITLTIQTQTGEGPELDALEAGFKKIHPNVSFKPITITDDQKSGTNVQVVSGNNAPDIAIVPTNSPTYQPLVKAKELEDLSDVWAADKLDEAYGAETAATMKWTDGKPYVAVVDRVYYDMVYFNKDLFDKAGVAVPADHRIATEPDLYAMVNKFRAAGIQPVALGGTSGSAQYAFMLDGLLASNTTDAQYQNLLTSFNPKVPVKLKFTDKPFVSAVQQIQTWADKGVFRDGYLGQTDANAQADFTAGKVAMYISLSTFAPIFEKANMNFDWVLLPPVPGGKKVRMLSYEGGSVAVPTHAKHVAMAKEFVKYWMSTEGQTVVAKAGVSLPAVNTVDATKISGLNPKLREMVADAKQNGAPVGFEAAAPGGYAITPLTTEISQLLSGSLSVDQLAANQQQRLDKIRANGGN